jgi:hypothetical protein
LLRQSSAKFTRLIRDYRVGRHRPEQRHAVPVGDTTQRRSAWPAEARIQRQKITGKRGDAHRERGASQLQTSPQASAPFTLFEDVEGNLEHFRDQFQLRVRATVLAFANVRGDWFAGHERAVARSPRTHRRRKALGCRGPRRGTRARLAVDNEAEHAVLAAKALEGVDRVADVT